MLAFVGEANDGLLGVVCPLSTATGNRLGVFGTSPPGTERVGDNLRRLEEEDDIETLLSLDYRDIMEL